MNINSIIRYFDLASETRPGGARAIATDGAKPAPWLPQYVALLVGILVQPPFEQFRNTMPHHWDLASITWGWVAFALIVAVVIFPGIYKSAFDPTKPLFLQLCAVFTAGLGWQALLETGIKAAGK